MTFSIWDLVLIFGVSSMVTVIAFVPAPRVKALIYSVPIPFALANLALRQEIGAGHAAGALNLLLFLNVVRWLHVNAGLHIVPSIGLAAATYIGVGAGLNAALPDTPTSFWIAFVVVVATAIVLLAVLPLRMEQSHRSDLPVPAKFAAVAAVVTVVVILKGVLGGFMTTFPLAGVVSTYETRKSLWTMSRQAPLLVVSLSVMILVMRIAQQQFALSVPASLVPGVLGWAVVIAPLTVLRWRREDRQTSPRM